MMKEELLEKIAEILEVDNIVGSEELMSFDEWDSLTALSIIALMDSDYGKLLTNDQIKEFKTINDIVEFAL